jgi:inosine-uridine nucleoside N-ribohydrolase
MTDLIVETDLGHDPDDFFTLCYLAAVGVRIRAVCAVPGDRGQLAVARLLRQQLALDIPVGVSKLDSSKLSSGGLHHRLLDRFDLPREADHDGPGDDVMAATLAKHPGCEFLVIGPCTSTARYLARPDAVAPRRLTMQGGFLGYLRAHEEKKWHDPTAAACHLHPEIGTWVRGRVAKIEGGWGTVADEERDLILADVDREALWDRFRSWK